MAQSIQAATRVWPAIAILDLSLPPEPTPDGKAAMGAGKAADRRGPVVDSDSVRRLRKPHHRTKSSGIVDRRLKIVRNRLNHPLKHPRLFVQAGSRNVSQEVSFDTDIGRKTGRACLRPRYLLETTEDRPIRP